MAFWSLSNSEPGSLLSTMDGRLGFTMCSVVSTSAEAFGCMVPKAHPREFPAPEYIYFSSKGVSWVLFASLPVHPWNHHIFIAFIFHYFQDHFKY